MPDRFEDGMKIRRAVLGDDYVDAAEAGKTGFDEALQTLITEAAWGNVWARATLPLRERSMLTIALLAAGGNFDEIAMHIRATANTDTSPADVTEALLHVAVYAGLPKANRALKIARQTYAEMGVEV